MSTLLVITAGRTDVQLVEDGARYEFGKEECATIHDELERRQADWTIVDAPQSKHISPVKELPRSAFRICSPKLDAVLRHLGGSGLHITCALILDTRRKSGVDPEEPRYAGLILERRLRETGDMVVRRATYLTDSERLADTKDPRGRVIRQETVHRIECAVRDVLGESTCERVVVAATGGPPGIAALVEEIVRLRAQGMGVEFLEVEDGAKRHPPGQDRAVPRRSIPEPAESFRSRRHALDLIANGNFLGAWGAVRHLDSDEVENQWTRVVHWLYLFAASLPLPASCDIVVLKHRFKAVRAAVRVELALRSEDIPRAVHGTVAFFESALWDHLSNRLTPHPDGKRRLFQVNPPPDDILVRSTANDENEKRRRPFESEVENGVLWYRIHDDDACAIRLAKHYLQNQNLKELGQAISPVRELRNDVDHNEPTPELMADACRRMVNQKLWGSAENEQEEKRPLFLTQPLVRDVLRDLGEPHPDQLIGDLLATIKARLLDF
jgi:hypothetical protein